MTTRLYLQTYLPPTVFSPRWDTQTALVWKEEVLKAGQPKWYSGSAAAQNCGTVWVRRQTVTCESVKSATRAAALKKKRKSSHCITPETKWKLELAGLEEEFLGFIFFIRFCVWLVQNVCNRNAAENSVVVTNTQNIERKPKQYIS